MSEVIQRTANGVDVISLDTFNCDRRTLCIRGEITQESAFEFALTAAYLNSLSETEAITVYINSPGGDIDAGLLMYDVIQASPAPIRVVATPAGLPHRRQYLVHQDDLRRPAGDPGQTQHAPGKAHRQDPGTNRRNYETRPFLHR